MTRIPPLGRGQLAALARLIDRPYQTVHNWQKYRLPEKEREAVGEALKVIKEKEQVKE